MIFLKKGLLYPLKVLSRFLCILLIALSVLPLFSCESAVPPKNTILDDYRNIPGITEAEIESVEGIRKKYASFELAMMAPNAECFYGENGELKGFSALFCQWLTVLFDIPFTPAFYNWNELIAGLADYSISFTGELTATAERREFLYMTNSICERPLKVMSRLGIKKLAETSVNRTVRYCFLAGSTAYSYIDPYVSNIEVVYAESFSEVIQLFEENKIDAFVADGSAEAIFSADKSVLAEDFSPMIYAPVSLTTQNPGAYYYNKFGPKNSGQQL